MRSNKQRKNQSKKVKHPMISGDLQVSKRYKAFPPPYTSQHVAVIKRRYELNSTAGAQIFLISDGHKAAMTAISTTVAHPQWSSWRIKSIEAWAPVGTQGTKVELSLIPVATTSVDNFSNDPPIQVTDSSISPDLPAHIRIVTNPTTPLGGWHLTTTINPTGSLFSLEFPLGTILDIVFEYTQNFSENSLGYTFTSAGFSVGTQYVLSIMSSTFRAVGVNAG